MLIPSLQERHRARAKAPVSCGYATAREWTCFVQGFNDSNTDLMSSSTIDTGGREDMPKINCAVSRSCQSIVGLH